MPESHEKRSPLVNSGIYGESLGMLLRCPGSGDHSISPPLPELGEQKGLQEKALDLRPQLLFSHSLFPLIPQEDKAGLIISHTGLKEGAVPGRPLLLGGAHTGWTWHWSQGLYFSAMHWAKTSECSARGASHFL